MGRLPRTTGTPGWVPPGSVHSYARTPPSPHGGSFVAITRGRLSFQVPWQRRNDAYGAPNTDALVAPAAPAGQSGPGAPAADASARPATDDATPRSHSRGPVRGPDGRFITRSAVTDTEPRSVREDDEMSAAETPDRASSATGASARDATLAAEPPIAVDPNEVAGDPGDAGGADDDDVADDDPLRGVRAPRSAPGTPGGPRGRGPIRIVLVEDVPEVVAHVREMLRPQSRYRLLQVITQGRRAVEEITELQPDVVLVDTLLQGRTDGRSVIERLRASGNPVGIVALTVRDHPLERGVSQHVDAVVTLPFGTLDLGHGIADAHAAFTMRDPSASSRTVAIFSAKGGVGKTTIALNLAVALAQSGLRTVLVDGNLQFGDVRRLLRADPSLPSICDLPTDGVRGADLVDAVVGIAPGVDALLAPPRPELADLVTAHDLERIFDVLRTTYQCIVVDTPSTLAEPTLGLLDAADLVINVMTPDAVTLDSTRMIAATFVELGYPAAKVRYLVNRFDAVGALPTTQVARIVEHVPDYTVTSDWQLVSLSNAQGVPFVLARPEAGVSADVLRVAHDVRAFAVVPAEPVPVRQRARGR